jgi:hypothetical protein
VVVCQLRTQPDQPGFYCKWYIQCYVEFCPAGQCAYADIALNPVRKGALVRINFAIRYLLFLVLAASLTNFAGASIILGLLPNSPSTAGGGATSTRSGPGSWQLYAIESADATDFGISSYNIVMSGTTAINHRSPVTTIQDGNGDPQTAGFNLLRTGTNVNPIQGSQGLPGTTPFLIFGFGQTASDFITKSTAIDAGAVVVGPTTSGAWGNYNNPVLSNPDILVIGRPAAAAAELAGHKWIFLAEGLGPAGLTAVTAATFTVYSNVSGTSVATSTSIISLDVMPEPASAMMLLTGLVGFAFTTRRR